MADSSDNKKNNQETSKLVRKLDLHVLPLLGIIYLFSYLERTNIANAKLAGLEHDIGLTPQQYRWCLSIFFIGYVIFEVPSNIILSRSRPSKWIALITFLWGVVATSMAVVQNFYMLLLTRFLLGVFEAGLFPGLAYYTSLWYRKEEQAIRLGSFWSFSALAGAFGGLIAYGITQIKSTKLAGWQWIFLIEGIPTIILAIICWFCLPDSPEQARFLNEEERQLELDRLAKDAGASHSRSFSWSQVLSVFTDWKTYVYSIIYMSGSIPLHGVTLFLPTLIDGMGKWTPVQTQLMTVPAYIMAFITILAISRSSDYFAERAFHIIGLNILSATGLLILIFVDEKRVNILYIGVVLITSGNYGNVCLKVAWFNNNFASLTRRAVASALIVSIGSLGGAIGGQIYQANQKPRYILGNQIALSFVFLQSILTIMLRTMFIIINRRRSRMNCAEIKKEIERYGGHELAGDHHPEFRYIL